MTTSLTQTSLKTLLIGLSIIVSVAATAQQSLEGKDLIAYLQEDFNKISNDFEDAYKEYPTVPRGTLEAISYQYRRFSSKEILFEDSDEHTIPRTYTVMGLTADGKGVFRENLQYVETLSSFSKEEILESPRNAIFAYAEAFAALQQMHRCFSDNIEDYKEIFIELSELPYAPNPKSWSDNYPISSSLYEIYRFLSDSSMSVFTKHCWEVDFEKVFGEELYKLEGKTLRFPSDEQGIATSPDYDGAIWLAAASCNYTQGRNGTTITGVTIHYTQGTYSGTLAWFQNCSANASAHYIIRSSDGQVTQMVRECDKAWHVGTANSYTIGVEHEAYGNIASYFTENMYQSSANLVRDICQRHSNINPHRTFYRDTLDDGTALNNGLHNLGGATACTQIRGHQHYPNQSHTDPGPYWNWNHYYHLLNTETNITIDTSISGIYYDSGGSSGPYDQDERQLFLIRHHNADSISLDFEHFDLETNYDFLWIYDGNNLSAPLLGRWNTSSPGHITSSGDALLVEFRSDCATQKSGWEAHWVCHISGTHPIITDTTPPTTTILHTDSTWMTGDFTLRFEDNDDQSIRHRLWQIVERHDNNWLGNPKHGFLYDNFESELDTAIWQHDGNWLIENQRLTCQANQNNPCRIYARHHDEESDCYLFEFDLAMTGGENCSFYFHSQKDNALICRQGYEIRFERSLSRISIYRIADGSSTLLASSGQVCISENTPYSYKVLWDTTHHRISLFRGQTLLAECETGPLENGNLNTTIGFCCSQPIMIDNLRSYSGRSDSAHITVGDADTSLMRIQASHGTSNTLVRSIVMDDALNFSTLAESYIKIDYSPPAPPTGLIAFVTRDNSIRLDGIPIYGQWDNAMDEESGIAEYEYILHVTLDQNICLRDIWHTTTTNHTLPRLQIPKQSRSCKINVRCKDQAGNLSGSTTLNIPLRQ
ncbi:MAG: N-acetylmuramoyl-L-alanine amidase [Bacteroidales bacterium]|nr:N-acetylmuramoyl-L-alanine amidase [Bacteroidales bacterium]